jgi:PAS domain S-box-containing protein
VEPLRVLIVDDHEAVRRGIRSFLASRHQWSICGEAADGVDAVEKAKVLRPDVMIMDISMPRMDGIEATRIIQREVPETRVVIISQNDPAVVRRQAAEAGARAFVAKVDLARDLIPTLEHLNGTRFAEKKSSAGQKDARGEQWLFGGGMLGQLIREKDWSQTPLGAIHTWPQSLKTSINLMLNSQHPMWIGWGPEMTFLYNDAYISVLSLAKHPQVLGHQAHEVWPEIWDICGPLAEKVFSKGEPSFAEDVRLFMSRGDYLEETYYSFSYSPIYDESGRVAGLFCPSAETTAKVLHARRLRTLSELSAKALIEKSTDAACASCLATLAQNPDDIPFSLLYLLDADGNSAKLEGSSRILQDVEHISPMQLPVDELSAKAQLWQVHEAISTSEAQVVSVRRIAALPAGPMNQPVSDAMVLPLSASGQERPIGVLITAMNPTRKLDTEYRTFFQLAADQVATAIQNARAAEEEKKRADALAEIDRAKTVFFSNVSHEFRTPLTLMLGPLEDTLAEGSGLSSQQRERLEVAHRNSLRLLKLVNTLLDFSRIEAGRMRMAFEPTDLTAFTAELASVFRSTIERAGLSLVINCPKFEEPVYVDREMWEKVVFNLLSNAFKFTFSGEIEVSLRKTGGMVEFAVRDTGTGIPPEELPHLFERFHRVKGARGRTFEGSGIGLAFVQELAKLHGGSVRVTSEVNRGSTFTVTIPAGKKHVPFEPAAISRQQSSVGSKGKAYVEEANRWLSDVREDSEILPAATEITAGSLTSTKTVSARILLADDNADMREYVRRLLPGNYEVEAVADGEAALAAIRQHPPDLVLTDVMMPKLDGFGLLKALRASAGTAMTPVILLSARAGEESRVEGISAGADDYLIKPFSARELIARVETHLKLSRLRRETEGRLQANEERLRASERRFREIIDALPAAIYTTDAEGNLTHFNPAAVEFAGRIPELGKDKWCINAKILLPDGTPLPLEQCPMAVALKEGRILAGGEFMAEKPDGTRVWFEPYPRLLRDAHNKVIGGINMLLDITDRKRAEAALQESHSLRQTAMDAGKLGAWEWDIQRNKVVWTDRVYEIQGLEPGTFGGTVEAFSELVHPDDLPKVQSGLEQALAGQRRYETEFRIVRPGGEIRWNFTCADVYRDAEGKPIRMIGIVEDISDRKLAEKALRDSEERFRAIVETTPECVKLVASDGTLLHMNSSGLEMVGAESAEEAIGKNIYDLISPEDRDRFRDFNERVCKGEKGALEFDIVGLQGTRRRMETHAAPFPTPDGTMAQLGVTRDVTLRKRAERTNGLLAAIVDSSDDAIVSKNLDGIITSWNKGAERMFGYTSDEAVGQPILMIIPSDRRHEEAMIINRLKQGERIEHFETVRVHKNGKPVEISVAISPVRDSSGRVVGASKVARDITEQKRIERALASGGIQQKALFHLADQLQRARTSDDIYSAALDAVIDALQCHRASILLYDSDGVMRFVSSRGLSDPYCKGAEGHSPWQGDERSPEPVWVNNAATAGFEESLTSLLKAEGIGALAFIPLVSHGMLIGKFMAYFNGTHDFTLDEQELGLAISRQLAFAIDRQQAEAELRRSEDRFRKLAETLDVEVRDRTKELEKRNMDIVRQSERLRDLSQRLMRSQDDERRHIARELHDSAGQILTVLGMTLARVAQEVEQNAPQVAKEAEQSQQLVQQLNQEIRTMSYLLHPPLLDESGLSAALSWYIHGLSERSDLDIKLSIHEDFGRLPRDLELVVFRLVQECLTNIHRHSGSKNAEITVARDAENISLEVQDHGKGISPERLAEIQAQGSGVGIRGMRERVVQFHGDMKIQSNESGTKVIVTFPISEETLTNQEASQPLPLAG